MGSFAIISAIFLWSSLGIVVRKSGVAVHVLMFYSCLVSLVPLSLLAAAGRKRHPLPGIRDLPYPLALGFVSLLNTFTFYYAYKNTTIANAVLTHYTAPVIVAFLAPAFLKEVLSRRIVTAIIIATAGLLVMLNGFSFDGSQATGIASGLFSGIAYAVIVIMARISARTMEPVFLAFCTNCLIALLLLPFVSVFPAEAVWSFLVVGIVHSTIAPVLYYRGLRTVPANRAAVLGYLEPVSAIIFGIIFLEESVGINTVLGGFLIILSGYLTLTGERS